jgi:hypothetical protein
MPRKTVMKLQQKYFLSATLAQTFNNRSSRIDWCGNYCPSPRRTFHSSRRSGSVLVLFCPSERIHPGGLQKKN